MCVESNLTLGETMSTEIPLAAADPGAAPRVQILATAHWSLLATRSLTYTESLSRVTIFLAILSGAVITLALVGQADGFGLPFISIAIPLLAVVVFAGVSTIARLHALNRDDYRWVIAMNRLRHAYLELYPELGSYFTTSPHDDLPGALQTLGVDDVTGGRPAVGSPLHLIQTLPGMLSVIVAVVAGAIGALAALAVAISPAVVVIVAAATFVLVLASMGRLGQRSVGHLTPSLEPRFPTPSEVA
jgi:hypothetical protein